MGKKKIFSNLKISEAVGAMFIQTGTSSFIYIFTASFMTLYYTNSVGISAAFLGTFMLIARALDAISDLIMGILIEKTNSKWGKARPWLLWSIIPMCAIMFFMFKVPQSLSIIGKNTYVSITYILGIVVCMTMILMSGHSTMTRMCTDSVDRGILYSFVPLVQNVFNILVTITVPYMLDLWGGNTNQRAWMKVTAIICAGYVVFTLLGFFMVKEHVEEIPEKNNQISETISLKKQFKIVVCNKYFWILLVIGLGIWGASGVQGGANIYYTTYVLESNEAFSLVTIASYLPAMVMAPVCMGLFKKYGKKMPTFIGMTIAVICRIILLLQPYNATWYIVWTFLASFAIAPLSGMIFSLAGDVSEYGYAKAGVRTDGLSTSALSFAAKVGVGLGSAILGWGLAFGKFDATLTTQTDFTMKALIVVNLVIPTILYFIACIGIGIWDIEKKIILLKREK